MKIPTLVWFSKVCHLSGDAVKALHWHTRFEIGLNGFCVRNDERVGGMQITEVQGCQVTLSKENVCSTSRRCVYDPVGCGILVSRLTAFFTTRAVNKFWTRRHFEISYFYLITKIN